MLDIVFLIFACIRSKNGRGRGLWIAALCIDITVGIIETFTADYPITFLFVYAGIMCAIYIPTGLLVKHRYDAFNAAQYAPKTDSGYIPYAAPEQPAAPYTPYTPYTPYAAPAQPAAPEQPAAPYTPYAAPAAEPVNDIPVMPPQARPIDLEKDIKEKF